MKKLVIAVLALMMSACAMTPQEDPEVVRSAAYLIGVTTQCQVYFEYAGDPIAAYRIENYSKRLQKFVTDNVQQNEREVAASFIYKGYAQYDLLTPEQVRVNCTKLLNKID